MQELFLLSSLPVGQLVALGVFGVIVTLLVGRIVLNSFPGKCPPVFEGVPFIGGLFKFMQGPMPLMTQGYAKYGEVFTVPVATKRITFLVGPNVAPHFFKAGDNELSQQEVYNYSVPTFGKGVVFDVDLKTRVEQFRFFTEALKVERLKSYVPQFVSEAEQYFSKWGDSGIIDFKDEFSKLITLTAARTLLGREVRENLFEQVSGLLHTLDEGMLPISVLAPYLPLAVHRARDRARKELSAIFTKVIRARRESGKREEDVLQQFIDAKYQNVCGGRQLTEDEITGMLIAVLFAGQHTSSITSAWTGIFMCTARAKALLPAVDEQRSMIAKHGDALSFEALGEMEVLQRNIKEALRIHPPLVMLLRYVKAPFTVTDSKGKDFVIPKGDIVAASPNFSHMLPHVFKEPKEYDPDRWVAPRDEDKATQFGFIGFGAGRHSCLGANFAYLQIKSVWSILLRNFDFEVLDPVPAADYETMVVAPKACRVRYTRRKL